MGARPEQAVRGLLMADQGVEPTNNDDLSGILGLSEGARGIGSMLDALHFRLVYRSQHLPGRCACEGHRPTLHQTTLLGADLLMTLWLGRNSIPQLDSEDTTLEAGFMLCLLA